MTTPLFQSKRWKWMVEMIQDSFEITSKNFNVNEVLQSEKYINQLVDFFEGRGPQKLLFYFQSSEAQEELREPLGEQQFILAQGDSEKLLEKAIYFLRTTEKDKPVNMGDCDSEVLFGEINPNLLEQLNLMMTFAFQPLVEKLDKVYWGECD